jgi:hypothetical protein
MTTEPTCANHGSMHHRRNQRWSVRSAHVVLLLTGVAVLATACARGPRIPDPTPDQLRMFLNGQPLEMGAPGETLDGAAIHEFEVVRIAMGPEGESASAVVQFRYDGRGPSRRVDGVITYQRSVAQPFHDAVLEVNDVR